MQGPPAPSTGTVRRAASPTRHMMLGAPGHGEHRRPGTAPGALVWARIAAQRLLLFLPLKPMPSLLTETSQDPHAGGTPRGGPLSSHWGGASLQGWGAGDLSQE